MDKKTLLAIALSFLILVVWQLFFTKPAPKPAGEEVMTPQGEIEEVAPTGPAASLPEEIAVVEEQPSAPAGETAAPRDIIVEGPLYTATISTAGGRIAHFTLTKYDNTIDDDSPPVDLVSENTSVLSPRVDFDTAIGSFSDDVVYTSLSDGAVVIDGDEKKAVTLTYVGKQFKVEKTYTFDPKEYGVGFAVTVTNLTAQDSAGDMSVSLFDYVDVTKKSWSIFGSYDYPSNYMVFVDKSLKKDIAKDVKADKAEKIPGNAAWFGFDTKYFMTALITEKLSGGEVEISRLSNDTAAGTVIMEDVSFPAGGAVKKDMVMYLGPKQVDVMDSVGYSLSSAIDYGFFGFLSIPLVWLLAFFFSVFKNYGVAIILLTVVVRIVLFPFTYKSMKSMKQMQKLQPLMAELREKYKNDKEKMNQEVMRLYQTQKINPLGGCLPLLLQLPVFIALYKALYVAIELRHSPFIFWIKDLSEMDPYYVTPIIMGASYFLQQKLTPSTMDPTQQKIMLLMPVIFTVIFLNLPAGLVLYFFVSNLLSIAQQLYMNKFVKD
jgi:YidC/Oxa1 family membrane protein insertase